MAPKRIKQRRVTTTTANPHVAYSISGRASTLPPIWRIRFKTQNLWRRYDFDVSGTSLVAVHRRALPAALSVLFNPFEVRRLATLLWSHIIDGLYFVWVRWVLGKKRSLRELRPFSASRCVCNSFPSTTHPLVAVRFQPPDLQNGRFGEVVRAICHTARQGSSLWQLRSRCLSRARNKSPKR